MTVAVLVDGALAALGLATLLGGAGFAWVSVRERESRATLVALLLTVALAALLFSAPAWPLPVRIGLLATIAALLALATIAWFLPIGAARAADGRPTRRVDERDIMFARARLVPGTHEYTTYYEMRPEHRDSDDRTRALPGLLSPEATLADAEAFADANASFAVTEALRDAVDGPVAVSRREQSRSEATEQIKRQVLELGARDVGVCELRPYHVYTHIGRGSGAWGAPVRFEQARAIAFTVEMNHAIMRRAPAAPVVAESARQYVASARIAVEVASTIRSWGYAARAHIDGNYRVIAPLVAMDAGLGSIGRMGILMTPRLGPRVRIGVVTTDLPLAADRPGDDASVIDFCTICKKCALNCPSRSIPFDDREPIDDGFRWAIDPDSCFRYWCATGTDCGRCMTVCPYSHPDNLAHNVVRWGIRRSGAVRRVALWADDLFYGRIPAPLKRGEQG